MRMEGSWSMQAREDSSFILPRTCRLGLKLSIAVMFLIGYELAHFDVTAEIIWKDFHLYDHSEGYQYGLKIVQILDEDHWKLKQILRSQLKRGEDLDHPPLHFRTSPPE